MAEKRSCWGATRNNLIFNDVCIFRVGDPATLKMLNSFIVSLLRGAPYAYCSIGNLFFRTIFTQAVQVEYLGEIKRNPKICVNL